MDMEKYKEHMKDKILLFFKGMLMGICDLIPGISGGTIAFITGIYTRLINAIKAFSPKAFYNFFQYTITRDKNRSKTLKQDIKNLDLGFLFVLFLGIATSIFSGSRIIKFLLENYFAYTLSFFIGLILASSKIIFDNIQDHKKNNMLFGIIGFIVGISLIFLVPADITPNLFYVFIGGFIAISALFLPGISGAFILLIMGLYEFVINCLHNISENILYLIAFSTGAALGAFSISRIISFLFKKDRCKTLYFLLGLVLGAISVPIKKIYQTTLFNFSNISIMLFFFLISIFIVLIVVNYSKVLKKID
jgi:putative membrane protein